MEQYKRSAVKAPLEFLTSLSTISLGDLYSLNLALVKKPNCFAFISENLDVRVKDLSDPLDINCVYINPNFKSFQLKIPFREFAEEHFLKKNMPFGAYSSASKVVQLEIPFRENYS